MSCLACFEKLKSIISKIDISIYRRVLNIRQTGLIILLGLTFSVTRAQNEIALNSSTDLREIWRVSTLDQDIILTATPPFSIHSLLLEEGINNNRYFQDSVERLRLLKAWQLECDLGELDSTFYWEMHLSQVDLVADVNLNGENQQQLDNYFTNNIIPLNSSGSRVLIELQNHYAVEKVEEELLGYGLPGGSRVFSRRPAFLYGWDWAHEVIDKGIHSPVKLIRWQKAIIRQNSIRTLSISPTNAEMVLDLIIECDSIRELGIVLNDERFHVSCQKGTQSFELKFDIKNPKLWWCKSYGDPHLYTGEIIMYCDDALLQNITTKYGVRTAELVTLSNEQNDFYIKLNGKKVFCKGANWVPPKISLGEIKPDDYKDLIESAVISNFNMLRVWGGGRYEKDLFYKLCDEHGIMVWQDFMFACAMYPWDDAFLENVSKEVVEQVTRLRKHPSLVLWCGNNENAEGWERWGWKDNYSQQQQQQIKDGYDELFKRLLPQVVQELNPELSYWESSPNWGRGDARFISEGDAHDWGVWHDEMSFIRFELKIPLFMSEFGFQSFPSLNTMRKNELLLPGKIDYPDNIPEKLSKHQGHNRGFKLINNYSDSLFTSPENIYDWVYLSQITQAEGIAFGAWKHRFSDKCNGSLYWQFNDAWPCVSWSGLDYDGNWKALQYYMQRVFADVAARAELNGKSARIELSNHSAKKVKLQLILDQKNLRGESLVKKAVSVDLKPFSNLSVESSSFKRFNKKRYLKLSEASGLIRQRTKFAFLDNKIKLKNSQPELQFEHLGKGKTKITIYTSGFINNLGIYSTNCSGKFSDNFFDLEAGEKRVISFSSNDCQSKPQFYWTHLNKPKR